MGQPTPFFAIQDTLSKVGSTNDYLKQFVNEGQPRSVWAREQTSGRGRRGRVWVSPRDQGLYASFLIYPGEIVHQGRALNMVLVLAVVETIREIAPRLGVRLSVKRPNDVLIRGRKVCGVLVEIGRHSQQMKWAVLGVGLNLFQTTFPSMGGISHPPTSLILEGIDVGSARDMFDLLSRHLQNFLTTLQAGHAELSYLEEQFRRETVKF